MSAWFKVNALEKRLGDEPNHYWCWLVKVTPSRGYGRLAGSCFDRPKERRWAHVWSTGNLRPGNADMLGVAMNSIRVTRNRVLKKLMIDGDQDLQALLKVM